VKLKLIINGDLKGKMQENQFKNPHLYTLLCPHRLFVTIITSYNVKIKTFLYKKTKILIFFLKSNFESKKARKSGRKINCVSKHRHNKIGKISKGRIKIITLKTIEGRQRNRKMNQR